MAIHRRAAKTKKTEFVGRFRCGKFLGQKKPLPGARGAINITFLLKQGRTAIEPGERIRTIGRPADIETAKGNLQQDERQQTRKHGDEAEPNAA